MTDVNVNPGSNVEIDSQNSNGDNQTTAPDLRASGSGYNKSTSQIQKKLKIEIKIKKLIHRIKNWKAKKSKKADTKRKLKNKKKNKPSTTKDDKNYKKQSNKSC